MSYILESLKKSEKERRSVDSPAAAVIDSPEFLENDREPMMGNLWIMAILIVILLAGIGIYYWLFQDRQSTNSDIADAIEQPSSLQTLKTSQTTISQAIVGTSQPSLAKPLAKPTAPRQAREEAVLLYEQALQAKQPDVNNLYQKLIDQQQSQQQSPVESTTTAVSVNNNGSEQLTLDTRAVNAVPASFETTVESANVESESLSESASDSSAQIAIVPSIYELDTLTKRNIPPLDYGAHIYATDNESGFIILNGARRRVGDQLNNGVFIEKIAEESVVLSHNGVVFSLPAMKSWTGK